MRFFRIARIFTVCIFALGISNGTAQSLITPSPVAYAVSILAGVDTPTGLKDGVGEEASFIRPTAIWGDGTNLYIGDGPALRRIEIASRNVTTVTRLAASGRSTFPGLGSRAIILSGIGGLWGDGTNIYATDTAETTVRRINLSTGLVDDFSGPTAMIFGLVGDGRYLYGGASAQHVIKRVDRTTRSIADFATPPEPIDPYRCAGGSGCLGYWVAAPTSLIIDGDSIYATGYNTRLRIINRLTGEVTSSPDLPFVPTSVWASNGVAYLTEYGGSRIGKLNLATGANEIVYPGDASRGSLGPIWGDGRFMYIIEFDHILRLDLATGTLEQFAGRKPNAPSVDGVGAGARFKSATHAWSDGANLYIVDAGRIRKLNLITAEVTTLSTPPVRGIWGDGTYLYATSYEAGPQLLRITLNDGTITTLASLSDPNRGGFITGDSSNLYVSESNLIERVALDGSTVTSIQIHMPFYGGGAIWSDGTYLFIAGVNKIVRYSIATGDTRDFALLPSYPNAMWSDGQNIFVSQNSLGSLSRLLRVSIATGEITTLLHGGTDDAAGTPIDLPGSVWGVGDNLYLLSGTAIYKLAPTLTPVFSSFTLPDRAVSVNVTATRPDTDTPAVGSAEIQVAPGSGSSSGLAIITHRQNGIVTSEMTVPATSAIRTGRIYASVTDSVNTGLAMYNPNDQPAVVRFYFTSSSGNSFASGSLTVAPYAQISAFLNDPVFALAAPNGLPKAIEGTFTFDSTVPLSAIAVRGHTNERSEFLVTSLPVADLSQTPSSTATVIPHFAQGGGWTTSVVLVNITDGAVGGLLEIYADDGSIVSTTPYAIAPRSSSVYVLSASASIQIGWIRTVPSGLNAAPSATAIFSFRQNGVTVTEAAATAFDPATNLRVYTESGRRLLSGVAVANPASHSATVYFQPTASDGMPVSTPYPNVVSMTLPAFGHLSSFTQQLFSPGFVLPGTGLLRIWTDSPEGISVAGLTARYNERDDFLITASPPFPESASATPNPTYFATIIQGGGYTTEMVIFGNTPGKSTSGNVHYFSQSGSPLVVPLY